MASDKKNLLLVEDEAIIALSEKHQLERYGYTVTLARNGEDAVEQTTRSGLAFDAVLMDINLGPGINGTQAATEILEAKDIPIIFVSSHVEPEVVSKTENITSYGYVVKDSGIVVLDASIKMAMKLFIEKSERRRAENLQRLSAAVLAILNEPCSLQATSHRILDLIHKEFDIDAVGIRLKDEGDFPYFSESGFDEDFLLTENSLLLRDETGKVCRDPDGRICLECTCGLVLSGLCGPPGDSVTPEGSLWTNDSLTSAAAFRSSDPRRNPRDRCSHDGYLSVALIPIRVGKEIIGLLHLNDRRKDRFTPEVIRFFEGLAASFGIAVERKRTEERLRLVEERFRLALVHAPVSLAVQDLDLRFTWAYNQRTRKAEEIIGKTDYELFPEDAERLVALKHKAIETGESVNERLWITSNGHRVFLDLHLEPLRNERGEIGSLGLSALDLTDFRDTEERLFAGGSEVNAAFGDASTGIPVPGSGSGLP